jgi:hypothetical protein
MADISGFAECMEGERLENASETKQYLANRMYLVGPHRFGVVFSLAEETMMCF